MTLNKRLLYLLIGSFLLLAPASTSGGEYDNFLKWCRVVVVAVAFLIGYRYFKLPRISDISGKILLLASVFCCAALWSTSPVWGILYKSMFVFTTCAAISLAHSLQSAGDFRQFCRIQTLVAYAGIFLACAIALGPDGCRMWNGRLFIAGLNPNGLGFCAVIFLMLSMMHLLIGDLRSWNIASMLCVLIMSILILLSGSRGALLAGVSSAIIMAPLMLKKKKLRACLFAIAFLFIASLIYILANEPEEGVVVVAGDTGNSLRMFDELTRDTRINIWSNVLKKWAETDVILGYGWFHRNNRWSLVQSSYIQVIIEAGVVGLLVLVGFGVGAIRAVRRAIALAREVKGFHSTLLYVFVGIFLAMVVHGVFESSSVVGTTPNAILFGFSAAQLDLQSRLVREELLYKRLASRGEALHV